MDEGFREKMIAVCRTRIAAKEDAVGVSFYVFFKNKNDDPALLMEIARWWIETNKLDHFEKATKVIELLER